jgi:hypothetical protein
LLSGQAEPATDAMQSPMTTLIVPSPFTGFS